MPTERREREREADRMRGREKNAKTTKNNVISDGRILYKAKDLQNMACVGIVFSR